jgi:uncharacterized membrane protein YcaP (DUF421 family)
VSGLAAVGVRALFSYLALLALLRAAHKRAVAEATPFDFVLCLILGDMVDDLLWGEAGAAQFTVAVGALAMSHALVAFATYRNRGLHDVLDGTPTVLLREGRPVRRGLRAELLGEEDLDALLRLQGIPRERWPDVQEARLEISGELSHTERPPARELRKDDLEPS